MESLNTDAPPPATLRQRSEPAAFASVFKDPQVVSSFIGIIPGILGILAVAFVLLAYRDDIRQAIPRLSGVEAFGLKVSLIDIRSWAMDASLKLKDLDITITDAELKAAIARAKSAGLAYRDSKILWVDDHPGNNRIERRALTALGSDVTVAVSNAEASDRLRRADYDAVISDLTRDNNEDARQATRSLASDPAGPAVLYYVGHLPHECYEEAFGVTVRPDKLINLVTDVLERRASGREKD